MAGLEGAEIFETLRRRDCWRPALYYCGKGSQITSFLYLELDGIEEGPRQLMRRGHSSIPISNRLFSIVLCLPPREVPR